MSDWVQRDNLAANIDRIVHKADGTCVTVYKDANKDSSSSAAGTAAAAQFPKGIASALHELTGLDAEQFNNIMKLVSKPEQDDIEWNKAKYMGYCEALSYDSTKRGYTISFFGATTGGKEAGDADRAIFKPYGKTKEQLGYPGKEFVKNIQALGKDDAWCAACWRGFIAEYVVEAATQAKKRGLKSALAIGFLIDTALNQGKDMDKGLAWVLKETGTVQDESAFLTKVFDVRDKVVQDPKLDFNQAPNGKKRVDQWRQLLHLKETDLKNCDATIKKVTSWEMK